MDSMVDLAIEERREGGFVVVVLAVTIHWYGMGALIIP
jgi:hypothetical protein